MDELPWDDIHHRSSFLPDLDRLENDFSSIFSIDYVEEPQNPIFILHLDFETNLENISAIIPIDISIKLGITENVHICASFSIEEINMYKAVFQEFWDIFSGSYEEMPGIDPNIVIHKIKTYIDANLTY